MNLSTTYSTINQKNENIKRQIEICCTWGQKLADGILTYDITNAKPELKEISNICIKLLGAKYSRY
jgi:hypothetical protein